MNRPPMTRTDGSNAFAHHTMSKRIPGIIQDLKQMNTDYPSITLDALERLHNDLISDKPIPQLQLPAPDYDMWQPALQAHAQDTWLQSEWFFAENYVYRLIMQAVRWWEFGRDPFAPKKAEEVSSDALWRMLDLSLSVEGSLEARLTQQINFALWGNRLDLSYKASAAHGGEDVLQDDLLVDDSAAVVEHLLRTESGSIHVVADNFGTEIAMDLALIDTFLHELKAPVVIHLKLHPTFVSDATTPDILSFLKELERRNGNTSKLGQRLAAALQAERLQLAPDQFWNSSYLLWQMPTRLHLTFQNARLVILKGDANYRRMIDDAIWPPETPLSEAVDYFPASLLALRTLKSDPVVGLPVSLAEKLDAIDKRWRNNGRRGVVQFLG